jgi:ssDNA-binding Zn-finger/Zn-ribbon topoisomerase 1
MADFEEMAFDDGFTDMEAWLDHIESKAADEFLMESLIEKGERYSKIFFSTCKKNGCDGKLFLRITKDKESYFWGCSKFPACRHSQSFLKDQKLESICEKCGGNHIIKFGYHGAFVGCSNYPKCKVTLDLPFSDEINSENYKVNNYKQTKLE